MEDKSKGNENKIILGDFNCTIDVVPIMLCQNSSWKMGSRIYGEGRTQILLIDPLAQDPV